MSETSGSTANAVALGGIAVLLAGSYVWYAVVTHSIAPRTALESGLAMAGPAGIVYVALKAFSRGQYGGRVVLSRCLLGLGGAGTVGAVYLASQALQGVSISRPIVVLQIAAGVGAVGGLLIGIRESRLRRRLDRFETQEETFVFLNNTLRHHVLNSTQIIQGRATAIDDTAAALIEDHCERIAGIVQNVGVLSEVLAEGVDASVVNLSAVVASEVRVAREQYPDAEIQADLAPGVRVEADQFLGLVCENLLDNAIEHNDQKSPSVEVEVDTRGETALLRIADDGPGIEDPAAAFERGTRGDSGVGLYLARTLVEGYGGDIAITDNDPEGTVVTVELPAAGSGEPKDSFEAGR